VDDEGLDLPGIGEKRLSRLEDELGGREGLVEALERGDVARLSTIDGISRRRAVRMVKTYRGDATDWLTTDDAERLARQSLQPFLERTVTSLGRGRLETLGPAREALHFDERLETARDELAALENEDLDAIADTLAVVEHPTKPRPSPQRGVSVLVGDEELHDEIREEDMDRWVDVATREDPVEAGELVLAVGLDETPKGAVRIDARSAHEAVPWPDRAWANANDELLEALAELAEHLDAPDHATPILEALEASTDEDRVDIAEAARGCVREANETVEEEIADAQVSGEDVLEVMKGGTSSAVQSAIADAHSEARKLFEERTGVLAAPFTDDYPLEVDPKAVQRIEREKRQDRALQSYRNALDVARTVREHREGVETMVSQAVELDRWQAIARASHDLGLSIPDRGDELGFDGALHLDLEGEGEPVDYRVPDGVALLTGANSGGKTTLLETIGQIAWLAHLGLPVPAQDAEVPLLDGLAYYERPRQLGAGAFEGFLQRIEEVLLDGDDVLVLADELEAMTELEAAAAILAEVVERLDEREAPAVLVTHLAPYILEHVDARTDGIEARGLDDDNELLVDRTPQIGTLARSTPELILQRLRNSAGDEREALYGAMLDRLDAEDHQEHS
jgi:hypothetical protein